MSTIALQRPFARATHPRAPLALADAHPETRKALLLDRLREALDTARALKCDVWDFALDLAGLRLAGVSDSDLRWAVVTGLADHRLEVTAPGARCRSFIDAANLQLTGNSCFAITDAGKRFTTHGQADALTRVFRPAALAIDASATIPPNCTLPVWDPNRRQLRVDHLIVKEFKVPAANQELILAGFQELGWPVAIDDPLPPRIGLDRKRRLHDTINSLNRNQRHPLLKFRGKGDGLGVCWELRQGSTRLPPDCV